MSAVPTDHRESQPWQPALVMCGFSKLEIPQHIAVEIKRIACYCNACELNVAGLDSDLIDAVQSVLIH